MHSKAERRPGDSHCYRLSSLNKCVHTFCSSSLDHFRATDWDLFIAFMTWDDLGGRAVEKLRYGKCHALPYGKLRPWRRTQWTVLWRRSCRLRTATTHAVWAQAHSGGLQCDSNLRLRGDGSHSVPALIPYMAATSTRREAAYARHVGAGMLFDKMSLKLQSHSD
jgi:hypothetical protein